MSESGELTFFALFKVFSATTFLDVTACLGAAATCWDSKFRDVDDVYKTGFNLNISFMF